MRNIDWSKYPDKKDKTTLTMKMSEVPQTMELIEAVFEVLNEADRRGSVSSHALVLAKLRKKVEVFATQVPDKE